MTNLSQTLPLIEDNDLTYLSLKHNNQISIVNYAFLGK